MGDRLTEISIEDLKRLRDLYAPDGIKSYSAFVTIDTYIRWIEQDPRTVDENFKLYSLNGNISDGTFLLVEGNTAFGDTLNKSSDELFRMLRLFDYSTPFTFYSYGENGISVFREVVQVKNLEIELDDSILLYHLPKERALEFDIQHSDEIELGSLTKRSDIEYAYSVWPQAGRNPIKVLLNAANHSPSVAAFTKDGTPVAWILRHLSGCLMALQTHKDYQKKGLGLLVTKALSRKVAEMGQDPYTTIFDDNIASQRLFEKLGFQRTGRVYMLKTKAKQI